LIFRKQFNTGTERHFIGIFTWDTDYVVNIYEEGDHANTVHPFQKQLF